MTAIARRTPASGSAGPASVKRPRRALDIGTGHRAAGAACRDDLQIDAEPLGQGPHRRGRLDGGRSRGRRFGRASRRRRGGGEFADHRAGVGARTFVELDQRRTDLDPLAGLSTEPGDPAGLRRRHFDHRLFGLDRDERLVGHDMVALGDVPGDELGLLQAFAEIGQDKGAHEPKTTGVFSVTPAKAGVQSRTRRLLQPLNLPLARK